MATRYFTLDEANAALPAVRGSLVVLMQLQAQLRTASETEHVVPPGMPWLADPVNEAGRVDPARNSALADGIVAAANSEMAALEARGIQVRDVSRGLVDFPTFVGGLGEAVLCWKLGEPRVAHFHLLEAGFAGRRTVVGYTFHGAPSGGSRASASGPSQG